MIATMVILGILVYVFLARVFYTSVFTIIEVEHKWGNCFCAVDFLFKEEILEDEAQFMSVLFPVITIFVLLYLLGKQVVKLADFVTNPKNYKFKIKFEKTPTACFDCEENTETCEKDCSTRFSAKGA